MMEIRRFVVGPLNTNMYLVISGKEAVVIDPGEMSGQMVEFVNKNGIKVKYVLATHGHFDHINGSGKVCGSLGCSMYINEYDAGMAMQNPESMKSFIGIDGERIAIGGTFSDGQEFKFGDETMRVMQTPGHTAGSTCFFAGDCIFSGDTIFRGTIGRTDIGGSGSDMARTLEKFRSMAGKYRIYPGHGADTTLEHEQKTNPFLLDPDSAL
jgi:glyoxylase-like metal-dependent hydrolase (beta-lactamase superfamily II)